MNKNNAGGVQVTTIIKRKMGEKESFQDFRTWNLFSHHFGLE